MQNLLRPNQIADLDQEERQLEAKMSQNDVDKGAVNGQLKRLRRQREMQSPKPLEGRAKDSTVQEQKDLLAKILDGMPSREEMRKAPPGAVDKHIRWEKKNKEAIIRWKNNELRLNHGSDDTEIANLERYRPEKSSLSMDNAFIPGKQYHMPAGMPAITNVVSEEDRAALQGTRLQLIKQAAVNQDRELAKFLGFPSLEALAESLGEGTAPKKRPGKPSSFKVEDA